MQQVKTSITYSSELTLFIQNGVTDTYLHVSTFSASLVAVSKESARSAGDPGSIPGLGRCPGEINSNPLQYPCLGNLMDRGAWWAAVHGVSQSQAQLSDSHLLTCLLISLQGHLVQVILLGARWLENGMRDKIFTVCYLLIIWILNHWTLLKIKLWW